MNLDRHNSEPAYWTLTSDIVLDGPPPEIAIGTKAAWYQAVWDDVTPSKKRRARLLVAGPDAPVNPQAVVVPLGEHRTWTRTPIAGAHIVREASRLYCS